MRLLVLSVLAAPVLNAQLQLFTVAQGNERSVPSQLDLGRTFTGDPIDTQFRVRNSGVSAQQLQRVSVSGAAFSLTNRPPLPYTIAPGAAVDFTVRFQPAAFGSYSASLDVNSIQVLLRASAANSVSLLAEQDGVRLPANTATPIDFGKLERGTRVTRRFVVDNQTGAAVTISRLAVTGDGFEGPLGASAPMQLANGASAAFDIAFQPRTAGNWTGTLDIDQRSFRLTGAGLDPPYPKPVLVLDPQTLDSGSQGKIAIRLESASRLSAKGALRMEFRPALAGAEDPAIQLATGGRFAEFSIQEGDTAVSFAGGAEIKFQTGTTAGSIVFTAQLGGFNEQATVIVASKPVTMQSVLATQTATDVALDITGFDNTRTASQLFFTFYDKLGSRLGDIRADATRDFRDYFAVSQVGGAFVLRALFPVTGKPADISAVEIEMINTVGTSRTRATY